jgi:hypothetical protein
MHYFDNITAPAYDESEKLIMNAVLTVLIDQYGRSIDDTVSLIYQEFETGINSNELLKKCNEYWDTKTNDNSKHVHYATIQLRNVYGIKDIEVGITTNQLNPFPDKIKINGEIFTLTSCNLNFVVYTQVSEEFIPDWSELVQPKMITVHNNVIVDSESVSYND